MAWCFDPPRISHKIGHPALRLQYVMMCCQQGNNHPINSMSVVKSLLICHNPSNHPIYFDAYYENTMFIFNLILILTLLFVIRWKLQFVFTWWNRNLTWIKWSSYAQIKSIGNLPLLSNLLTKVLNCWSIKIYKNYITWKRKKKKKNLRIEISTCITYFNYCKYKNNSTVNYCLLCHYIIPYHGTINNHD